MPRPRASPAVNRNGPIATKVMNPVISRDRVGVKMKPMVPLSTRFSPFSRFARMKATTRIGSTVPW